MARVGLALFAAALLAIAGWRAQLWHDGPYAAARSLAALLATAPEERPGGDFLGSDECASCHPEAYRAWHDSYHRTMTQHATPDAVIGDFDDVALVHVTRSQSGAPLRERFRLSRRGDEFWVSLLGRGRQAKARDFRALMTTGSHHHQMVWVSAQGDRRLINLPFTWLVEEGRWIPRNDAFLAPPDAELSSVYWNEVCIECHSTAGRPYLADDEPAQTRVAELGIACESCHGPAGEHVAANRPPWRRYAMRGEEDPTIVNPKRLAARQSAQVCGRCHAILSYPETDAWEGHWNEFRPGDDLESQGRMLLHPESRDPSQRRAIEAHLREEGEGFVRDRFWSDGAVRVAGRELNDVATSPCYEGGEFSCLSCHSMHDYQSVDDQLAPDRLGDASCLQCHPRYEEPAALAEHSAHPPDSAGSRCQNCHLPHTTYGLLKAIRSHRVTSPSVAVERESGRPNACNLCHLDRNLAWTQAALEEHWDVSPTREAHDESEIAAGPRWIATGDAGVRALAAWHLGWGPAREASGMAWMAPYLAELLSDDYAAVRYLAARSLRSLPDFADLDYDFVSARGGAGDEARRAVQARWAAGNATEREGTKLPGPLGPTGIDREAWERRLEERDDRGLMLLE